MINQPTHRVLMDVADERKRQEEKWGDQSLMLSSNMFKAVAILTEEVGEVAKEALEHADDPMRIKLRTELVQVAAVAVACVEAIDR
jgi:NTP pyrophosphatase (non-canonical NTP hydrolase)